MKKNIAKEYEAIYKSDYICGDVLICNDDEVRQTGKGGYS